MEPIQLPQMRPQDVRAEIARIATECSHRVVLLDHANDRALQRGITTQQIFKVLRSGEQLGGATWDASKDVRGWRCKLCRVVAGVRVTVIAKLIDRGGDLCLVITVW